MQPVRERNSLFCVKSASAPFTDVRGLEETGCPVDLRLSGTRKATKAMTKTLTQMLTTEAAFMVATNPLITKTDPVSSPTAVIEKKSVKYKVLLSEATLSVMKARIVPSALTAMLNIVAAKYLIPHYPAFTVKIKLTSKGSSQTGDEQRGQSLK